MQALNLNNPKIGFGVSSHPLTIAMSPFFFHELPKALAYLDGPLLNKADDT